MVTTSSQRFTRPQDRPVEGPTSPSPLAGSQPLAWFGGRLATGLAEISHDVQALDDGGWWAVVLNFEGELTAARFTDVRPAPLPETPSTWRGPAAPSWATSLDSGAYQSAVLEVQRLIREGEVYQVNVCRVLEAALPESAMSESGDPLALAAVLATGNPAPHAGVVRLPGRWVVTASPELFLRRRGLRMTSSPIKGTGLTPAHLTEKDAAENVMIVDLVRNDLQHVCLPGTVRADRLLDVEHHPGLVHLVSTVSGVLRPDVDWPELLAATFPPGSVSGAPKHTALQAIQRLEPVDRGPYCGAVGWVDADRGEAELAVGIRTFWWEGGVLRFGTGAGITADSDPQAEWQETELKAARLVGLASERAGA